MYIYILYIFAPLGDKMKLACNPGKKKLNFRKHTAATAQCMCLLFDYMGDKYDIMGNKMEFK